MIISLSDTICRCGQGGPSILQIVARIDQNVENCRLHGRHVPQAGRLRG